MATLRVFVSTALRTSLVVQVAPSATVAELLGARAVRRRARVGAARPASPRRN